jgi:hypothetical protein
MSDKEERTPEEWEDAFEAIVDDPDQQPLKFYVEISPISPEEDVDVIDAPKYRSLQEAIEAWKKEREQEKEE